MSSDMVNTVWKWSEGLIRDGVRATVPDWLIESQLADHFRDSPAIQDFAVFGYGEALRVAFTARVAGVSVEQIYELAVAKVVWEKSRHELVLAASKVMTHYRRCYHQLIVGSLAGLPSLVIPYVGGVIGRLIVDRLVDACVNQAIRPAHAAVPARFDSGRLVINLAAMVDVSALPWVEQLLQALRPVGWQINREGLEVGFAVGDVTGVMVETAVGVSNQAVQLAGAALTALGIASHSPGGPERRNGNVQDK
jgi:hypothetical protein